jgi:hypothetical protein
MDKELALKTFRNTLGAAVYIFLVSQIMVNGNALFGKEDNFLMPFVFLLLFSLSAAVVGGLVVGLSVMLFLEGKKKESVRAAVYSIGWLALFTVLGILTLLLLK